MRRKSQIQKRGKQKREQPNRNVRRFTPRDKREAAVFEKVLAAVSLSRREGLDLCHAAKIEGTRVNTIKRYAPSALEKHKGKYRVKPFDRIPRALNVVGNKGMRVLVVRSSRSASQISRYMNAVRSLIYENDPSLVAKFRGKKISGHRLVTDIVKLKQLADAGLLGLDRLYASVTRGR